MVKILICGIGGAMGGNVLNICAEDGETEVVCGVDLRAPEGVKVPVYASFSDVCTPADVVVDFSSPAVLKDELEWAVKNKKPVVLAATGYTDEHIKMINDAAKKTAVFKTANFSLGVNLIVKLVKEAAQTLGEKFDIEIIERHHNKKVDAPSGTALMLAESVNAAYDGGKPYLNGREGAVGKRGNEIGIHAVRGGTIVGEHEVMFAGEDEIVTISHSARSKKVFAAGAIKAAKWICGKSAGLYDMTDVLENL